jgi:hypothetical protein
LRRRYPILGVGGKRRLRTWELDGKTLAVLRGGPEESAALLIFHFSPEERAVRLRVPPGPWRRLLDSAEAKFGGLETKAPVVLPPRRGGWTEVEVGPYAVVLYLRETAAAEVVPLEEPGEGRRRSREVLPAARAGDLEPAAGAACRRGVRGNISLAAREGEAS